MVQNASKVLMIRPVSFRFNGQTAVDNRFQRDEGTEEKGLVQRHALLEFNSLVERLLGEGIDVEVVEDTIHTETPDSIFPNNWVSFHEDGTVVFYPMMAENRRKERRMEIVEGLIQKGFLVRRYIDLSPFEQCGKYLEGTGSLVLDRINQIAYASVSDRTHPEMLRLWAASLGYEIVVFRAFQWFGDLRVPVYHTNVIMSICSGYALVCAESIDDADERASVLNSLEHTGHTVILLTEQQVDHFAGNALELAAGGDCHVLVMSASARSALTDMQVKSIQERAKIVEVSLDTIEKYGGGSARCMMAEIFLSQKSI